MGPSPLLNPLNVEGAAEVIPVFFLHEPTTLALGLTGLPAFGFPAVFLVPRVAGIREEEISTVLALASSDCLGH